MADKIQWIKNLLGMGTPAEQAMVREARDFMNATGKEKYIVGPTNGPGSLTNTLQSIGDDKGAPLHPDYWKFMEHAGKSGFDVSSAHPHPGQVASPSGGDMSIWGNDLRPGRGLARQQMWIAGDYGPNDTTMLSPMRPTVTSDQYELNRKIREAVGKHDRSFTTGSTVGQKFTTLYDDYVRSWGLSPLQDKDAYNVMAHAPILNRYADLTDVHIDPASQITLGRPDLPMGDVFPDWLSYLKKHKINVTTKAEGGQVEDTMPPFPLAYGSQYFDKGGQMKPTLAMTGPQIMRQGLDAALQHFIEYFGGLKSNTIPHGGPRVHETLPPWATRFQDTAWKAPGNYGDLTNADFRKAMQDAGIGVEQKLDYGHPIRGAINDYTGSDYSEMNSALRAFGENKDKAGFTVGSVDPGLEWWRTGKAPPDGVMHGYFGWDTAKRASDLAKYLQDQELELPYDLYRGLRLRADDYANLHPEHGPQVHGRGIGSFSYLPDSAYAFGQENIQKPYPGAVGGENKIKVPSVVRIPQGTKVRGMDVSQYSGIPTEAEVLLAPFQGFDVTDFNLISKNPYVHEASPRLLLNAEPSGIYDPSSPIIYNQGGQVPGYAGGGPEKGLPAAMRAAIEHFGGLKRNPITRTYDHNEAPWWNRFKDTSAPLDAQSNPNVLQHYMPYIEEPPDEVMRAMRSYSGEGYSNMNSALRFNSDPNDLSKFMREDQASRTALLARWLQDQQYELPFDIYRGSRMRAEDFTDLPLDHGPQVHGRGFGSFSFTPGESLSWGGDSFHQGSKTSEYSNDTKIPGIYRIPKGTKVPGYPIFPFSQNRSENEFLMAPFHGFDVTDTNLLHPHNTDVYPDQVPRVILDVEPSGIYDKRTPRIYGSGGQVPGYSDGGLTNLINYVRGLSKPVKAHHVSPHDFDRFSSQYIGTGEGNKNFGHGLYFMESPSLRDRYVKDLGEQFGGQQMRQYDVDIHGDPRHFLSLDEPLDTQGIIGARASDYLNTPKNTVLRPPELTFPRMESQVTDPAFSKYMSDEGAYGTRYFDSRSKKAGFGTQNYVTFPTMDDIIEITGKRAEGGQAPEDMPLAYMSQYYAEGGGYNDPPDRFSVPPSQFTAPRGVTTPTFNIPIGKGEATAGFSYDPESRLIDAILGYEHPLGKRGAKLGVQGNFNKYVGPGGNDVKPDWGGRIGLTLPFAEGGQHDPYEDIIEAQRLMGAYK